MPPQSPLETKKLIVFAALVTGLLGVILAANVAVRGRTSGYAEGAGTPRRAGLERLNANPDKCAMTADPAPDNERPMRHVNAGLIDKVDVLVLGQSDADHMSRDFFRDDVHFYNGFISNSYFVYHYELYLDLVEAHGVPPLVLYDVGSGYIHSESEEPEWDTPAKSPLWWGFPPFHLGKAQPLPWYKDIPSLLSLAQSQLTLTWLEHQLPQSRAAHGTGGEGALQSDNGELYRCVDLHKPSMMNRWMADGSRIYREERDAVFAPTGPVSIEKARGDRKINPTRLRGLDFSLGQIVAKGSKVIVYSPPVHPQVFDEPKQVGIVARSGAAVREVAEKYGLDYCDLTTEAASLGCGPRDFYDELHLSRHCNQMIVKRLASGCAPRAGAALRAVLKPAVLE